MTFNQNNRFKQIHLQQKCNFYKPLNIIFRYYIIIFLIISLFNMEEENTFLSIQQDSTNLHYAQSQPIVITTHPHHSVAIQAKQFTGHISDIHKTKMIQNTKNNSEKNQKNQKKRRIELLEHKIRELQKEIQILKSKNFCHKCGSKQNLNSLHIQRKQESPAQPSPKQQSEVSFANLQFERFEIAQSFITQMEEDPINVDGRAWIFTGMVMLLMGININGFDGTIDVYKITKQTVDHIRNQVEKSNETINFPIYYEKIYSEQNAEGSNKRINENSFELEGLRMECIDESDWNFQKQLNFNLKYQALIVMIEYIKQYASFS